MNVDEILSGSRRPPRAPAGLRPRGSARRLWGDILSGYVLRGDEHAVLVAAVRSLDEIELMRDTLGLTPQLMIKGGRGSVIAHPLLDEIRKHEVVFLKLLGFLGLDGADAHGDTASRAGSALVNKRWARRRGG